jgi:hypothetical protein
MRTKKALKQLSKAEALITAVGRRYTATNSHFQELLDSASATIGQAKSVLGNRSASSDRTSAQPTKKRTQSQASEPLANPKFTGNKTDFVRAVVEAHGPSGATPTEIGEALTARRINRSKNLIYNALSALVNQKKLNKNGNRYVSASINSNVKSAEPKKRISPEGLKRIREANQRRWAEKRAAQGAQATNRRQTASAGTKKVTGAKAAAATAHR